jgi:hypothetical protein
MTLLLVLLALIYKFASQKTASEDDLTSATDLGGNYDA